MRTLIFSLLLASVIGCKSPDDAPLSLYTLQISYIDGYVDTVTYKLPSSSVLHISSTQGGYRLEADYNDRIPKCRSIKEGVLRYKVISKTDIK